MTIPPTRGGVETARVLAIASASLLMAASAGFGAYYAWVTGNLHGPLLGALTVSMALGLELAKPFAIEGIFGALKRFALGRALSLTVLALVAVVYSLSAELSLMASARQDRATERQAKSPAARIATERIEAARKELTSLPMTRPSKALDAELERLRATPKLGPCNDPTTSDYGPVSRRICPEIAAAEVERSTALRREALQAIQTEAEHVIASTSSDKGADPASGAIAAYLSAVGFKAPATTNIFDWLTLIPVVALEVGSALSLVLVRSVAGVQPAQVPQTGALGGSVGQPVQSLQVAPERLAAHRSASALSGPQSGLTRDGCARSCLIAHLTASGGRVEVGQRQLARALRVSPTRVHQVLHELASEGRVKLSTGPNGTTVELAPCGE